MLTREQPYGNENQHVVIFGVVAYQLRPELNEEITGDEQYVNLIRQCGKPRLSSDLQPLTLLPSSKKSEAVEKDLTRELLEETQENSTTATDQEFVVLRCAIKH